MNEKKPSEKAGFIINSSDYVIFTLSSILYILNLASNVYVSYTMFLEGHTQWFATSISLVIVFSIFTQIFSHVFFTYNNIGDRSCSPYLQHINSKSGDGDNKDSVAKKEYLEIERRTVCPHSGYPDRLWTDKNLVDMNSHEEVWKNICSQAHSVILHLLHIGPVIRYVRLLKFRTAERNKGQDQEDIEEKKIKDIERFFCKFCLVERAAGYSLRDITLLRLFEALEAAPQVLLQLYLVIYMDAFTPLLLGPAILGVVQVSFCLALSVKYQRMPRPDRYDQTILGLITMTVYKIFLVSYRTLCLAVFGSIYRGYLILLLFTHSLIMLLWMLYLDTNFASTNSEEIAFNFTVAMLQSFTFVNVSDGRSKNRVILYHICITVENVIIAAVWYYKTLDTLEYGLILLASMGALYLMGVFMKTLYYNCCHPTKQRQQGLFKQEVSVMYKNQRGMITNPIKDSTHLLKHDDNTDVIRFPDSNTTPNSGSTWMLGFIEQKADSIASKRMMMTQPGGGYLHHPLRQRYNYDTYQSVSMDNCSGYDSEVASILSAKTPIYENLVPSTNSRIQHPITSIQHPISSIQHPISSIQHPISSIQGIHHPISSVAHPISSIQHPISNIQHPISSIQHPISNPILTNPMVWQPQQLNPPSGRTSAEQVQYNNDSLSSSGVYSEEERKLNLKARLDNDYDNIESEEVTRHPLDNSMSPESEHGDLYENLPTVIRQGHQVHSDGLTLQTINIGGPHARFDGSLDGAPSNQSWDLLKGSLNFAYGPCPNSDKNSKTSTADYTCLKDVQSSTKCTKDAQSSTKCIKDVQSSTKCTKAVAPAVPARTTSSTVKSNVADLTGSQHSVNTPAQYQTDV